MEPGQLHRENAGYLIAASSLEQALMRWNRVRAVGVESKKGAVTGGHAASSRFPSPLIEPDLQISPIRLSDQLHLKAHGLGRTA